MNKYQRLPEEVLSGKIRMVDIEGFEGFYGITEDGRGWRYGRKAFPGRWLTPMLNEKCDTPVFFLHIRTIGNRKTRSICKIVANAFIENPYNFSKVEIIDGNIHNSHYKNLKFVPRGRECVVEGKVFESEQKARKHYGIRNAMFKSRRKLGWSVDESLGLKKREYDFNNLSGFIYLIIDKTNGKKYIGQTKTTLERRLDAHFRSSEMAKNPNKNGILYAISCKKRENFVCSIIEEVENINDLNEREIFHIESLNTKIPNGYNILNGGGGGRYSNKVEYGDKKYASNRDLANGYGVNYSAFNLRIKHGQTVGQALGVDPIINKVINIIRDIEYNGIRYKSVRKMAEALGIPRTTIAARLNRGMSIKDAVEFKFILPDKIPDPIEIEIQGVVYKSKGEAARAHGINPSIFIKRLKEGWNLESAIGIKPRIQWHNRA